MTDEELFKILRPHVINVTGCQQVILAAQNKNAPKGSYGSIQVRYRNDERGQANIAWKTLDGKLIEQEVKPQRVMTCVVEFYRDNAKLYAERMQQMNRREDVEWPLFQYGISIRNVGNVLDLTALQSSNYEERARIEFVLWLEGSSKVIFNTIEAVEVVTSLSNARIVDDRIVPEDFPQPEITVPYVDNWANRIYADSRLGF